MIDIGQRKISVKCPSCGRSNTVVLSQVGRQEKISCGCGQNIRLIDHNGSSAKAIKDINAAMKNFERTLKRFGK